MNNEVRELVRDFLNGDYTEKEIMNKFDLEKCSECESIELEEDMVNHKWDIGNLEEMICQDCQNNE